MFSHIKGRSRMERPFSKLKPCLYLRIPGAKARSCRGAPGGTAEAAPKPVGGAIQQTVPYSAAKNFRMRSRPRSNSAFEVA